MREEGCEKGQVGTVLGIMLTEEVHFLSVHT